MHALMAAHNATPDIDVPADGALRSPVGTHTWKEELGAQLTLMAVNGREAASLKLSPDHLGPLEIRISVQDGQASVHFGATSAETRSALEQSMPRLRELFAAQGMVLADAGVSRDAPRNAFKPAPFSGGSRGSSDADAVPSVTSVTLARAGLVDTYV
jgi:flagellar hook-length control protein FliK